MVDADDADGPAVVSRLSVPSIAIPRPGVRSFTGFGLATALWTVALALVVGDLVLTLVGLEMGFRERNPVVAVVFSLYGPLGLVLLKAIALAAILAVWHALPRRYGLAALVGLSIPQGVAVVINATLIVRAL